MTWAVNCSMAFNKASIKYLIFVARTDGRTTCTYERCSLHMTTCCKITNCTWRQSLSRNALTKQRTMKQKSKFITNDAKHRMNRCLAIASAVLTASFTLRFHWKYTFYARSDNEYGTGLYLNTKFNKFSYQVTYNLLPNYATLDSWPQWLQRCLKSCPFFFNYTD